MNFYRRALNRHPQEPAIYLKLANLCDESLDDPASALFYYNRYLQLVPESSSDVESVQKLRNLVEQRLMRQFEKKYPAKPVPELEKLRKENAYLLKMNRALGKLLNEKQQTVQTQSKTEAVKTSKTPKKKSRPAKKGRQ